MARTECYPKLQCAHLPASYTTICMKCYNCVLGTLCILGTCRDIAFRVDPSTVTYHKPDPLADDGWVTLSQRFVQTFDHLAVNGTSTAVTNLTAVPPVGSASGAGALTTCIYWPTLHNSRTVLRQFCMQTLFATDLCFVSESVCQ